MKKGFKQFKYRYDKPNMDKKLNIIFAIFIFVCLFIFTRIILTIPFAISFGEKSSLIVDAISIGVGLIVCVPNALKKRQITIFNDFFLLTNYSIFSQKIKFKNITEVKVVEKGKMPFKDRIYGVGENEIVIKYKGKNKVILAIEEIDLFISILKEKNNNIVFLIPNDNENNYSGIIGKKVKVIVDRPVGTYHPEHKDIFYFVNYGYIPDIIAGDGEEQDAYILGINVPIEEFEGIVLAVIHRKNDSEDKYVVVPEGMSLTKEEIKEQTKFQEKYFDVEIIC